MALTIPVAHDFNCRWCWIGLHQAKRLQREFGVRVEWQSYELYPEGAEWPDPVPQPEPRPPSRFEMLLWADQMEMPSVERPWKMRTFNTHQAVQYAKTEGVEDVFIEALYRAFWEQGLNINEIPVLRQIAAGIVGDLDAMVSAVEKRAFDDRVVRFNEDAYAQGVFKLPNFLIGGERYAEQPYQVLRKAMMEAIEELDAYADLTFPEAPADRPYVFIDMVSTIDGRIVSGDRDESVQDLGSKVDHMLMKRIEAQADAVMLGAHTLRVTPKTWNPRSPRRFVVTRSGDLPWDACFLTAGESYVLSAGEIEAPEGATVWRFDGDLVEVLRRMRAELGIQKLLVLGGSKLNGQLLEGGLVDEVFLTMAPKIKLGHNLPSIAEGEPFERGALPRFELVEHHVYGDEIFLRYRRGRG